MRGAISRFDRGKITQEELDQVADEVTVEVIEEQADAGLDLVTDGQIRWEDEQTYLARKLSDVTLNGLTRWFRAASSFSRMGASWASSCWPVIRSLAAISLSVLANRGT